MATPDPFQTPNRPPLPSGKVEIEDIPRINAIVLTGLDFSMRPENARYEADRKFIKPFPEIKVMHALKSLAVMVYNQEKLTPYFHPNVCNGRNTLAHFICGVHRLEAPQPKSDSRQGSFDSTRSNSSSNSCKSKKNCELPKLVTTSMLPLGYWDGLYYAVTAEIRQLHNELQNRFGFGCEKGTEPIHHCGPDGASSNQAITAIQMACLLEEAWYNLMDNRLVATLDDAVRMRKMREEAAKQQATPANTTAFANPAERPPVLYGLMDVNSLSPEAIHTMLWNTYAPILDAACAENFVDESMFTAYRAELYARQVQEGLAVSTPMTTAKCTCHRACVCRLKCDEGDHCTCKNVHIYHVVDDDEVARANLCSNYVKEDNAPNHFIGTATTSLAHMQITAAASPSPTTCQAFYRVKEAINTYDRKTATRSRSNTNNSELAYVPESRALRDPKDAFPLDFYGRNSGQRYPAVRGQAPMSPWDETPLYTMGMPTRKAVPPPIAPPVRSHIYGGSHSRQHQLYLTPPSSGRHNVSTFAQAGPVSYPAIPVSQTQAAFTQTFPAPTAGNPRETEEDNTLGQEDIQKKDGDTAQDYIGLLTRHPSSTNPPEQSSDAFPKLTRSVTTSPPKKKATSTNNLPTLKSLNKPYPPLPQPDFIAPRPALKQRYVSAGGNTPLAEREEIPGPAMTSAISPGGHSRGISKEELEAKLSDPEWVRKNFGESAVGTMCSSPPCRGSEESSKVNSGRNSDESGRETPATKRERTSSSASKKVAKLKRVFSRKNSLEEEDSE